MSNTNHVSAENNAIFELTVTQGFHAGVTLPLNEGDHTIGSKSTSDIIFRDDGIEAQHFLLCVEGCQIRAEAIGSAIKINDQELPHGQGCYLRLPAELTIGGTALRISTVNDAQTVCAKKIIPALHDLVPVLTSPYAITAVSIFGCMLVAMLLWTDLQGNDVKPAVFITKEISKEEQSDRVAAEHALKQRLLAVGLDRVTVSGTQRHLTLNGSIARNRVSALTLVENWFEETYGSKLKLHSNVLRQSPPLLKGITLQAIWYGEKPYIVADDGNRYFEGNIIKNGWSIQKIGPESLLLKKGDETTKIRYR
jgi:hypothetical protein